MYFPPTSYQALAGNVLDAEVLITSPSDIITCSCQEQKFKEILSSFLHKTPATSKFSQFTFYSQNIWTLLRDEKVNTSHQFPSAGNHGIATERQRHQGECADVALKFHLILGVLFMIVLVHVN